MEQQDNDALTTQIHGELTRIVPIISELTGLLSHWNERVELVEGARYRGMKAFECDIRIRAALAHEEVRWRTLLHELLHASSVGFNGPDFRRYVGWEEGVVEQLQRLIRPTVLAALTVIVSEGVFARDEATHADNPYIAALENVRAAVSLEPLPFYIGLLSTPIRDRFDYTLRLGGIPGTPKRRRVVAALSAANAILKEGAGPNVAF